MVARIVRSSQLLTAVAIGIGIGMILSYGNRAELQAARDVKSRPAFTMEMRIGANLYLQTSAEYQAACLQVYRLAGDRLRQVAARDEAERRQQAVIMDLDETVFDNSAFQTYLYRTGQEYTDELWADYEKNYPQDITLIPGAKQFIDEATALGVRVVFLSNRSERHRSSTSSALRRLGLAGTSLEDRLFLKPIGGSSNKSGRRDEVMARYKVLLLLGDNLRDFAEVFVAPELPDRFTVPDIQAAIAWRKTEVDRAAVHWGVDWFIVPNPVYGEWDKLIKVDPVELMHPTTMPVR
jgi:5'-nucleotidase (lipoprotein e(P4) family)